MRCVSLVPALIFGLVAHAGVAVDLTQIGHIESKGRVQDQDNKVVSALVAAGPDAIPFLLAELINETEVPGAVLDFWPRVRVGEVALIVLLDLFTAPDGMQATIPGLSWDSVLDRRNSDAPASALLHQFISTNGRKGLQLRVEKLLEPHNGRLVWDSSGGCFRAGQEGAACTTPPAVASAFAPVFPDLARRARISGTATVVVDVDAQGRVNAAEASPGLLVNPLFLEAAFGASRRWKFAPASACESRRVVLTFSFKLPGAAAEAGVVYSPPYAVEIHVEAVTVDTNSTDKS